MTKCSESLCLSTMEALLVPTPVYWVSSEIIYRVPLIKMSEHHWLKAEPWL